MSRARDTCPIPPSPIAEVLVGAETGAGRESECGAIRRAGRPCGRDYTCKTPIWRQPADTPECPRVGLSSGTQAEMQLVAEDHRPQGARPADLLVANVRSASATSATRGPTAARHSTARYVPRTRTRSSARWYCRRWAVGRSWCKFVNGGTSNALPNGREYRRDWPSAAHIRSRCSRAVRSSRHRQIRRLHAIDPPVRHVDGESGDREVPARHGRGR